MAYAHPRRPGFSTCVHFQDRLFETGHLSLVALTYLVDSPAGHRLMEILNFIASTECRRTRETEEQTSAAVYVRDSATRP